MSEKGSGEVATIWLAADRRVASLMLYPETRAAVGRAARMGRLDVVQVSRARRRTEALWGAIDRIDVTAALARRAGELAERHGLRAYDAVHLASLEQVADSETVLVSTDEDLVEAARASGFATLRPGS